jgi:8-oxo-dGTP diphosphatase
MTKHLAGLILYDHQNKFLLQHRTDDAPTFPGCWSFFGGEVEKGETPEQAVKREALEELSYSLNDPRFWTSRRFTCEKTNYVSYLFLDKYDGSELLLGEGQGMGWFHPSEAKKLPMSDLGRQVFEELQQLLAKAYRLNSSLDSMLSQTLPPKGSS